MNMLTRQELNSAMQQTVCTISAKILSYQDLNNAIQSAVSRFCTKQDIQAVVDASRDRFADKIVNQIHGQQAVILRQLQLQLEALNRHIEQLELKAESSQMAIAKTAQQEVKSAFRSAGILQPAYGSSY
jgi:hypothetical protein